MSYDLNLVKRAVVFTVAVILALSNGAADRLVSGVALLASARVISFVHNTYPFRV